MSDFNISTPVYLITGILESGKTTFLNFTSRQDYFQVDGTTLLITCEEGEEEYDEQDLLKYNTVVETIEEPEDFTFENLRILHRKYHPERVLLEYNPLWGVNKLRAMKLRLWQQLSAIEGVRVNGPMPDEADAAPHILSVSFDGVRGEVMRNALEGAGVLVSTGSACASHKQKVSATLRAMGLTGEQADGTIRISLGLLNTMDEMDEAAARMKETAALLARYRRR